ncbi:MAG: serine O-acetyltransferase [bacterium]
MILENIRSDLARLSDNGQISLRCFLRGVLSQGFQAILVYRFFRWFHLRGIPTQPLRFVFERIIEITTGISIPVECEIGKGLRIHHFGGIVLHPNTRIGDNCTLYHQVTIGDKGGFGGAAEIGDNVLIGVGAKIIGEITIGDNCKIGANSVVAKSIPPDSIVFGNPCMIKGTIAHKASGELAALDENVFNSLQNQHIR